jgi:ADP-heptose:LPS heptosyltransferase
VPRGTHAGPHRRRALRTVRSGHNGYSSRVTVVPLSSGARLPGIQKIAVLRANALGDYLFAVPALQALRTAYPDSEIVLFGARWHRQFLAGRPGPVDRVVPVPAMTGVREPAEHEAEDAAEQDAFFATMHEERFDLAIQMHGGGRFSNPFVRRLGARVTAGLRTPDAAPLDIWMPYAFYQPEVARFLELVGLLGAAPTAFEPRVELTGQDRAEADAALAGLARPVVALHPGANDPRRRWPAARFAAVGEALAAAGASVVVTGSAAERDIVDEVVSRMGDPARPMVGAVTLGGLAAVYARCAVLVSNDTGPRHLAQAVGAATVGIFWCGNLINAGPLTRTRHRVHLSWTVHCPECGAFNAEPELPAAHTGMGCRHDPSFVDSVSVHAVLADAVELLTQGCDSRSSLRTGWTESPALRM